MKLDFNFNLKEDKQKFTEPEHKAKRRSTVLINRERNIIYRRAYSETQLLDLIPEGLQKGYIYNFITAGDVDALSFLKIVLRQQNLDYMLFSTWCMAADDILQIEEWLESGIIKTCDAYVGEIFPGTYKFEYQKLKNVIPKYGGRIAIFKNHSKIFAGIGKEFSFGIQTSANINTNPRAENACITLTDEIYHFYKDYFDKIVSFEKKPIDNDYQSTDKNGGINGA